MDQAGRVVIPKRLRDEVGITAGEVELVVDGSGIRVEPVTGSGTVRHDGWWVIDTRRPALRRGCPSAAHERPAVSAARGPVLLDTSVAVALVVPSHDGHDPSA
ncbi:MAG: AbrB/MazE/SpoVT family DNA-binding domain-containing protein [Phycicoccus sp.]